jgi:phage antirepressor YoqD-like protein
MNSIFSYNGTPMTFRNDNGVIYVNATEMAKHFEARPGDWLRTDQSKRMIDAMAATQKCEATDLVRVVNGGADFGTWMQEDIALVFAQWLSPDFYIWCNKKIKELIQNGYAKLDNISRKDLAKMLLEAEEEKERLIEDVARLGTMTIEQQKALDQAAPKVLFADSVTASESSILVGELAKILKQNGIEIGQNRLFRWLREAGYLCSRGESYNQPTQRAMELGLFEIKKSSITQPDGTVFVTVTTKVSPKGQMYFVNKFLKAA